MSSRLIVHDSTMYWSFCGGIFANREDAEFLQGLPVKHDRQSTNGRSKDTYRSLGVAMMVCLQFEALFIRVAPVRVH